MMSVAFDKSFFKCIRYPLCELVSCLILSISYSKGNKINVLNEIFLAFGGTIGNAMVPRLLGDRLKKGDKQKSWSLHQHLGVEEGAGLL